MFACALLCQANVINACDWNFAKCLYKINGLIFSLIEVPFNAFANRADPDQAALVKCA